MKILNTKTIGEKVILLEPGDLPANIPPKFKDLVVYSTMELKIIKDKGIVGDELLMLHGIKKEFPGSIIKPGPSSNYVMDMKEYRKPLHGKS